MKSFSQGHNGSTRFGERQANSEEPRREKRRGSRGRGDRGGTLDDEAECEICSLLRIGTSERLLMLSCFFDAKSDQRDSRSIGSGQPLLRGCMVALSADPFHVLCRLLAFPFSSVG